MKLSTFAIVTAAVLALPQYAQASHLSASLDGAYVHSSGTNEFSGGADALMTFDRPGFNLQIGANDSKFTGSVSSNAWSADGDFFYRGRNGAIGVSLAHGSADGSSGITSYGIFGEWYTTHNLSLRLKGGAFNGAGTGKFGGAGAEFYVIPNLGIDTEYDYSKVAGSHIWTARAGLEYQMFTSVPLSISATYGHTSVSGGSSVNAFGVGLKFRFGLKGGLVDLDRSGPTVWDGILSL